jgi:hypothetical protein
MMQTNQQHKHALASITSSSSCCLLIDVYFSGMSSVKANSLLLEKFEIATSEHPHTQRQRTQTNQEGEHKQTIRTAKTNGKKKRKRIFTFLNFIYVFAQHQKQTKNKWSGFVQGRNARRL